MERVAVLLACLLVVGFLAFFFVRSLRADRHSKPATPAPDTILAHGNAVVSYRPNPERLDTFLFCGGEQGVAKKLREILDANPEADLSELQDALGIVVAAVQRYKRREETDGIGIGDE